MKRAIIFDFDGVIGDTYQINFTLTKEIGNDISDQEFKDHHNGNVYSESRLKIVPDVSNGFFDMQKNAFTKQNLFPLKEILETLDKKYDLFIVSSTIDENISHFLSLDNYNKYFKQILGATTHKSKVEKFKMIFEKYDLKPEACLFITDTIGDIIEANKVNLNSIAVSWGYHDKDFLLKENPYKLVETKEELLEVIQNE